MKNHIDMLIVSHNYLCRSVTNSIDGRREIKDFLVAPSLHAPEWRGIVEDKQEMTLKQYRFQVKSCRRARGGVLLETNEGPRLLREYSRMTSHFDLENQVKDFLRDKGMSRLDFAVPNMEGNYVTEWESGEKFVVYEWYRGEECDLKNNQQLREMAENLGILHLKLKNYLDKPVALEEQLFHQYDRHNKELKRVYQFMKNKKRKSEFEIKAITCYPAFVKQAQLAKQALERSTFYKKYGQYTQDICHGEYNYHNLIQTGEGLATTNFEHCAPGIQVMDFVYFMRKSMEKNRWDADKGRAIWEGYATATDASEEQKEFVITTMSYPFKYWKLLNQYMNRKKTWLSDKSMEKLKAVCEQEEWKTNFLYTMRSF